MANIWESCKNWNKKHQLRQICGDSIVTLRRYDFGENGEKILVSKQIYTGMSDGYKSDFRIDVGEKIFEEMKGKESGYPYDLILEPRPIVKESLKDSENVFLYKRVSLEW